MKIKFKKYIKIIFITSIIIFISIFFLSNLYFYFVPIHIADDVKFKLYFNLKSIVRFVDFDGDDIYDTKEYLDLKFDIYKIKICNPKYRKLKIIKYFSDGKKCIITENSICNTKHKDIIGIAWILNDKIILAVEKVDNYN